MSTRNPPQPPMAGWRTGGVGYVVQPVDVASLGAYAPWPVNYVFTQDDVDSWNQILALGGPGAVAGGTAPTSTAGATAGGSGSRPQSNPTADANMAGYRGSQGPTGSGDDSVTSYGGAESNDDADAAAAGYLPSGWRDPGTESASANSPSPTVQSSPTQSMPNIQGAPTGPSSTPAAGPNPDVSGAAGAGSGDGLDAYGQQRANDKKWEIALAIGLLLLVIALILMEEKHQQLAKAEAV